MSRSQPSRTTSRSTRGGRDGRAQTTQPKNGQLPHRPERKELLDAYRLMLLIRRFEEKAGEMYQRAKIGGYCHLNLGEEATCVGLSLGMRPTDYLFTNYREHGYALARGIDPRKVMAELFGREGGVSRGRGGSMHLFDWEKRLLGGYAIVGGQLPVATGAALAIARKGGDEVVLCQMGDATTNIGAFHESLNIAALWKLPIVFAIINNGYGMGTSVEAGSAEPALYKKACAYEMPGVLVDGNDVFVVRAAVHEAVERARKDRVPSLLDIQSYRLKGHSVVDPDRYRSEEYLKEIRAKDPIIRFAERYKEDGGIDDKALEQVEEEVEHMVQAAVDFAEQSPEPDPEKLFEFSYATEVPNQPTAVPGKEPWVAT